MIDYEKLKEAHRLFENRVFQNGCSLWVRTEGDYQGNINTFYEIDSGNGSQDFYCIDDLINHLRELTKPKPKYEFGQEVCYLYNGRELGWLTVGSRGFKCNQYVYKDCNDVWHEEYNLYPTRESLIESQIEYWQSLLEPVNPEDMNPEFEGEIKGFVAECEHIPSDEMFLCNPGKYLCAKCGVFYR